MSVRLFRFGIDYLRYNLCAEFSHNHFAYLFQGLSENSKQKFDVELLGFQFTFVQYVETKQKLILNFYHDHYHIFTIERYLDMGIIQNVSYAVIFEGTFFAIPEIFPFLVTFTKRFLKFLTVSRIDIALDCNIKTETLWKWKRTQFRNDDVKRTDGHIETFYLGSRQNNKKHFIRVYDKKIDSMKKGKFILFHQYLAEDVVTRIEVEIHTITIGLLPITTQAILAYAEANLAGDENGIRILEQWFASLCMNTGGTFFYSLRGLSITKCEKLTTAKFTGRSEHVEKQRYVRIFLTYAKRLQELGFDVFGFLEEHLKPPNGASPNCLNYVPTPSSDTLDSL